MMLPTLKVMAVETLKKKNAANQQNKEIRPRQKNHFQARQSLKERSQKGRTNSETLGPSLVLPLLQAQ